MVYVSQLSNSYQLRVKEEQAARFESMQNNVKREQRHGKRE